MMKTVILLLALSSILFSQITMLDARSLYGKGNVWEDSISTRFVSADPPTVGLETFQIRSTVDQDTLYSNAYRIEKGDRIWRIFGDIFTDSVGVAPNALNVDIQYGKFYGTGGFTTVSGVEWITVANATTQIQYAMNLTAQIDASVPQELYFRFIERVAQRNHYTITFNIKRE